MTTSAPARQQQPPEDGKAPYGAIVFMGGGSRLTSELGALAAMRNPNNSSSAWFSADPNRPNKPATINTFGGVSAGSITAALAAAGLTEEEIQNELYQNIDQLIAPFKFPDAPQQLANILKQNGVVNSDKIRDMVAGVLEKHFGSPVTFQEGQRKGQPYRRPDGTAPTAAELDFQDMLALTGNTLVITTTDVGDERLMTMSPSENPTVPVATATARSSSAFPFISPQDNRFFDGGFGSNLPVYRVARLLPSDVSPRVLTVTTGGLISEGKGGGGQKDASAPELAGELLSTILSMGVNASVLEAELYDGLMHCLRQQASPHGAQTANKRGGGAKTGAESNDEQKPQIGLASDIVESYFDRISIPLPDGFASSFNFNSSPDTYRFMFKVGERAAHDQLPKLANGRVSVNAPDPSVPTPPPVQEAPSLKAWFARAGMEAAELIGAFFGVVFLLIAVIAILGGFALFHGRSGSDGGAAPAKTTTAQATTSLSAASPTPLGNHQGPPDGGSQKRRSFAAATFAIAVVLFAFFVVYPLVLYFVKIEPLVRQTTSG